MKMVDCPKFNKCSAPLCPLDGDWGKRSMLRGERVCFYLTKAVKEGAQERFSGETAQAILIKLRQVLPQMLTHSGYLSSRLQKAKKTGSRLNPGFLKPRPQVPVEAEQDSAQDDLMRHVLLHTVNSATSPFTGTGALGL